MRHRTKKIFAVAASALCLAALMTPVAISQTIGGRSSSASRVKLNRRPPKAFRTIEVVDRRSVRPVLPNIQVILSNGKRKTAENVVTSKAKANAEDVVTAIITCPTQVNVTMWWLNGFGFDPRFSKYGGDDPTYKANFESMLRSGQKLTCNYTLALGGQPYGHRYSYTAKRKIYSCTQPAPNVLRCEVAR